MRVVIRSFLIALLVIVGAVLVALTSTMTSMVVLAATAFYMGGTGHPLSVPPDSQAFVNQYVTGANSNYVAPSGLCGNTTGCTNNYAIVTPEQIFPVSGTMTYDQSVAAGQQNLDSCLRGTACTYTRTSLPPTGSGTTTSTISDTSYVVYGYSQSATVATLEKRYLLNGNPLPNGATTSFVLIANPNRPNGGFLARGPQGFTIPIVGATFSGPTPTNSGTSPQTATYPTVDIAQQYDGWADGPVNPLNLLADANAVAGVYYLHGNYGNFSLNSPGVINQGTYGDTQYYLIATPILPLLMPLESIPVIGFPLADTLDPPLRVLVESAYDRSISPGAPTSWNPLYFPNPITTGVNFIEAIPAGLDNGISDFTGTRPLGTTRPGPFGVGGPPVTYVNGPPNYAPTTTPTPIPVLFGSPGGFLTLLDPMTLLADLTTFSQLTSILNGGLPATVPSLLNPLSALTNLGSTLGQSAGGSSNIVPAVVSSQNDTPTSPPTQLLAAPNVPSSQGMDSGQQPASKNSDSADNGVAQTSTANTAPQQQPLHDILSSDLSSGTKSGPKLNVPTSSLFATPGSGWGTSSTGGSQSTVTNPIGSAISGVTSSIKSALGGLAKAGTSGTTK